MSPEVEFIVSLSPWWGGTTIYSDIVLPLCTLLEQSDITRDRGEIHPTFLYHHQCIEPMWESKSDFHACLALAEKLGVASEFAEGKTKEELLEQAYANWRHSDMMTYEEFKEQGFVYNPTKYDEDYEPEVAMRWFYEKPEGEGLVTPSGKIEFFSQKIFEYLGTENSSVAPVPKYYHRIEGRYAPLADTYPLELLTPHRQFRFHGQHDNVSFLRECYKVRDSEGYEHEPLYISTADAAARGIKDGDIVKVYNDRGAVLAGAKVTPTLRSGVVRLYEGAWFDPVDPQNPYLDRSGCCNVLTHTNGQSEFGRCVPDVTALVEVEKWEG
jgi:anaerobic selenocysteine-containing dehydrogenase